MKDIRFFYRTKDILLRELYIYIYILFSYLLNTLKCTKLCIKEKWTKLDKAIH